MCLKATLNSYKAVDGCETEIGIKSEVQLVHKHCVTYLFQGDLVGWLAFFADFRNCSCFRQGGRP